MCMNENPIHAYTQMEMIRIEKFTYWCGRQRREGCGYGLGRVGKVLMDVLMDVAATYKRLATRNQEYYGTQPSHVSYKSIIPHNLRLLNHSHCSLPPSFL